MSETVLTQEEIQRWIKDLRSGNYLQTREKLSEPGKYCNSYCCLGVLYYKVTDRINFLKLKEYTKLVRMNDVEKKNFNQIADWIEKNMVEIYGGLD